MKKCKACGKIASVNFIRRFSSGLIKYTPQCSECSMLTDKQFEDKIKERGSKK